MTTELPAQLYGKNRENQYTWLIRAGKMRDKPVDTAVTFEWKSGAGDKYPPVWALWVEPGQEWALLYCFEDAGAEPDGSRRPHTLRKSVGLCTRDALPLITSLLGGQLPEKHEVSQDGCWRIDYEQPSHVQTSAWRTCILCDGGSSCYELKFNVIRKQNIVSSTEGSSMPKDISSGDRVNHLLLSCVLLLLGGVVGYFICWGLHSDTYDAIEARDKEIRDITEQISQMKAEKGEQDTQLKRVRELVRQLNECLKSPSTSPPSH